MRNRIYVFGFDNTIVNAEDIIIDGYNSMFGINMTEDYWFAGPHNASTPEEETAMIQRDFHVEFTKKKMAGFGKVFLQKLIDMQPNSAVVDYLKEHAEASHILTGSPAVMVTNYLNSLGISIPEERLHCGFYNGSGKKEECLEELQKRNNVVYIDDDARLVKKAQSIATKSILVKHSYNKDAWKDCNTI